MLIGSLIKTPELSGLEKKFLSSYWLHLPEFPVPVQQFEFAKPERKFRADFAWPDQKVLVECEGGVWTSGKHGRPTGIETDCEKGRWAAALGYRTFRVTTVSLREDPAAIFSLLRRALEV